MICMDFDWQIDEFMVYCRSAQLREKSMKSYEQTLRLFERWCMEEMNILTVDKVTEPVIRRYITDLQTRGNPSSSIAMTKGIVVSIKPRFSWVFLHPFYPPRSPSGIQSGLQAGTLFSASPFPATAAGIVPEG